MARYPKYAVAFLAVAVIAVLAVCSKTPTNSGDLIFEGKMHMEEQEYSAAIESFKKAIEDDPLNSEALYLHSKAVLRSNQLSILDCMEYVNRIQTIQAQPESLLGFVTTDNWEHINTVYTANVIIARDLKPIFEEKTHGFYDKHDIIIDYLIASTVKSILGLVDIFAPYGVIDHPDDFPNLGISWNNGEVVFDSTALKAWADSLADNPAQFNETIDQLINNLDDSQDIILALAGEELDMEVDDAEMGASVDSMKEALQQYRWTPNVDDDGDIVDLHPLNPVPVPTEWTDINGNGVINDASGGVITKARVEGGLTYEGEWTGGDWGVDEELLDGKDNDNDGRIDEDFSL